MEAILHGSFSFSSFAVLALTSESLIYFAAAFCLYKDPNELFYMWLSGFPIHLSAVLFISLPFSGRITLSKIS